MGNCKDEVCVPNETGTEKTCSTKVCDSVGNCRVTKCDETMMQCRVETCDASGNCHVVIRDPVPTHAAQALAGALLPAGL